MLRSEGNKDPSESHIIIPGVDSWIEESTVLLVIPQRAVTPASSPHLTPVACDSKFCHSNEPESVCCFFTVSGYPALSTPLIMPTHTPALRGRSHHSLFNGRGLCVTPFSWLVAGLLYVCLKDHCLCVPALVWDSCVLTE